MPHYKCVACRVRLRVQGSPRELVGDLCPECGSLLQPAGDLSELVGFRSIERLDGAADAAKSDTHQRIADFIEGVGVRRVGNLNRDRLEAERWLDDGDADAQSVALPLPETHL